MPFPCRQVDFLCVGVEPEGIDTLAQLETNPEAHLFKDVEHHLTGFGRVINFNDYNSDEYQAIRGFEEGYFVNGKLVFGRAYWMYHQPAAEDVEIVRLAFFGWTPNNGNANAIVTLGHCAEGMEGFVDSWEKKEGTLKHDPDFPKSGYD